VAKVDLTHHEIHLISVALQLAEAGEAQNFDALFQGRVLFHALYQVSSPAELAALAAKITAAHTEAVENDPDGEDEFGKRRERAGLGPKGEQGDLGSGVPGTKLN
jgi:hypothetical protein